MNEDLHEAILRMAEALVGVTEAMTRIVDALPDRCIDEDEDLDLEIEDEDLDLEIEDDGYADPGYVRFNDADFAALASANQNQWRLYRDHLKAAINSTEFRAALLNDEYQFQPDHNTYAALKKRLESVELAKVTFKVKEGLIGIEDIIFDDFSATAYGCVVFSDIGPIAYYNFRQPQRSNGGRLTISSAP